MKLLINVLIGLVIAIAAPAQSYKDSLLLVFNDVSNPDTVRLAAGHQLIWQVYLRSAPDTARFYAESQLALAKQYGRQKQISSAYNSIGATYHIQGNLESAIDYYQKSLEMDIKRSKQSPGDGNAVAGIASSYTNIAVLHQQLGNIPLTIENLEAALHLLDSLEKTGAEVNIKIANVQNNIGMANDSQRNTNESLNWYRKALIRYEKEEPSASMANALSNIGNAHSRLANEDGVTKIARDSLIEEAARYQMNSLEIRKKMDDRRGQANALNNLGASTQLKGSWASDPEVKMAYYLEAEEYYREAASMAEAAQDNTELANILGNLAENLLRQKRNGEAMEIAKKALEMAQKMGHAESMMRASEKLYMAYKQLGRPLDALEMYEQFSSLADSVRNEENTRQLMRQQYAHEYSEREAELVFEQRKKDAVAQEALRRKNLQRNAFVGGFALTLLLALVFFTQRNRIGKEKKRSEELLLNILPEEVAEELKAKGEAEAQLIDQVTVLFTDFKGFTQMSEQVTPKQLVKDLHECFSAFDHICQKYGIEKIKTIGDAYMAAGGLPTPSNDHAEKVIRAGLEMRDFVEEGKQRKIANNLPFFGIRIGIHTGPVVAGIVGVKKFSYDIWGDTVNTASRMESSGEVGKVNLSESTYVLVKDEFSFEERGEIEAKGKGKMRMYFVSEKRGSEKLVSEELKVG